MNPVTFLLLLLIAAAAAGVHTLIGGWVAPHPARSWAARSIAYAMVLLLPPLLPRLLGG